MLTLVLAVLLVAGFGCSSPPRDGLIAETAVQKLRELKDSQFLLAVGFWKNCSLN